MHARRLARTLARTHARTHARMLARTHARTQARTLARTHARTLARTLARSLARSHARTLTRPHAIPHSTTVCLPGFQCAIGQKTVQKTVESENKNRDIEKMYVEGGGMYDINKSVIYEDTRIRPIGVPKACVFYRPTPPNFLSKALRLFSRSVLW